MEVKDVELQKVLQRSHVAVVEECSGVTLRGQGPVVPADGTLFLQKRQVRN